MMSPWRSSYIDGLSGFHAHAVAGCRKPSDVSVSLELSATVPDFPPYHVVQSAKVRLVGHCKGISSVLLHGCMAVTGLDMKASASWFFSLPNVSSLQDPVTAQHESGTRLPGV